MNKFRFLKFFILLFSISGFCVAQAEKDFQKELDEYVTKVIKTFNVPGISVAIVKDSTIFYANGYGTTSSTNGTPVNQNTIFGIASNTKAFTAAGLAILVDQGKIKWNDRVKDYLPHFEMYDPYVTNDFRIKDLLTHQSGLSGGYGDLMLWPSSDFTRKEIVSQIKYFKPTHSFRTRFGYSNILYITAGEVINAVTGKTWEEFTRENILKPLEMNESYFGYEETKGLKNLASPHVVFDKDIKPIKIENTDVTGPAATIYSTADDISKWMLLQLHEGTSPQNDKEIFSKRRSQEMWTPVTVFRGKSKGDFPSTYSAYGLGWGLREYKGNRIISHTGGLPGMVSQVTLVPEKQLGIAVFTNQQSGAAFVSITNYILEHFFKIKHKDHIETLKTRNEMRKNGVQKNIDKLFASRDSASTPSLSMSRYCGEYEDPWYGKVVIENKNGELFLTFPRSKGLTGKLAHFQYDTFTVKWENRIIDADCFIYFWLNEKGEIEKMKMKPISPLTDFSYDFQDLDFKPIKKSELH